MDAMLTSDELASLRQYDGLATDIPLPPKHILKRVLGLRLITRRANGFALTGPTSIDAEANDESTHCIG
jgi:hypothetical protein